MRQRKVTRIVRGRNAVDGAGVRLRRILGDRTIQDFDPFLMLDGFDSTNPQDYIKGFPWHPHRGIETVTYLVSGTMAHEDSLGNKGVIRSMGCQWMTAGSGILHQEMPQPSERLLGCQLWVNLPATKKMVPPTYRDISLTDIPVVADKATVRILSGCYQGIRGALNGSHARVTYLDITLPAGILWSYEEAHNNETLFMGEDLQSVSRITGISSKNLVSMYKRGIRQIHLKWRPYSELKRELDHMYIKYRNNEFLLTHSEEVPKKNFRYVKIVWKEQDIPAEYVDLLSIPLSKLDINFRALRAFRKYNIYQLEDLLRFIKYNGFDALYKMPGIGTKSIEQLYEKLKEKKILEDQDTCFLFPYLFV